MFSRLYPFVVIGASSLFLGISFAHADSTIPSTVSLRSNEGLVVTIDTLTLPRGHFNQRFERLGRVSSLRLGSEEFVTGEGIVDETGIREPHGPLGFQSVKAGESFVKMGVGELVRGNDPTYRFQESYPVRRWHPIEVSVSADSVWFLERATKHPMYRYSYRKTYLMESMSLVIRYELHNVGDSAIGTEQYNHNWFSFQSLGEPRSNQARYRVKPKLGLLSSRRSSILMEPHLFEIETPLTRPTFQEWVSISKPRDGSVALIRVGKKYGIEMRGRPLVARFALYAERNSICPEIFIPVMVAPGEIGRWERKYTVQ